MKKTTTLLASLLAVSSVSAVPWKVADKKLTQQQAKALTEMSFDGSLEKVVPNNILKDELYVEMAKEGWTLSEIVRLTDSYVKAHKAEVRKDGSYVDYHKRWKPYFVSKDLMDATLPEYTSPQTIEKAKATIEATQEDPNAYHPRILYTVEDRQNGKRNTGRFRHNACLPAGGRIHWLAVHPENPDRMLIVPDSEGIWKTDDLGKTWECITERIPNRYDRNQSDAYSIPVDPDNWDHIYAFMNNSTVYKTLDGGDSWEKINRASHKGFKRGYCYRDARGKLRFIGAKASGGDGSNNQLWVSQDTCKSWKQIVLTDAQKDIVGKDSKKKMFWFQELAFHPTNRDLIFAAGSRGILMTTDGGDTWARMKFEKVYGATTETVRATDSFLFPLETANTPMFLTINPNNGNEMWAALGSRDKADQTGLFKSSDGGKTWITLFDKSAKIGTSNNSVGLFGNESAWNWLGGFAPNYVDQTKMYGCSMSSAESANGGSNWQERVWHERFQGIYPDGKIFRVSVSSHNADNHFVIGHKTGRIFRGSDGGIFMIDPKLHNYNWVNISGNMGQMMFYTSMTNEFGDFSIVGNTQDINIETYRGGRWGKSHGYEGSTIWINPFSGEEHFPYPTGGSVQISNQDYGSWNRGWVRADVCTGNWFIKREGNNPDGSRFGVIKDFGKTTTAIDKSATGYVSDFALSRDVPTGKLFIIRNNAISYSTDSGEKFTTIKRPLGGTFTHITVNPDNSNEIYLGGTGAVYQTLDGGGTWTNISNGQLSGVNLKRLMYHEGSGDLYFVSSNHGIFLKESNSADWKLWTKGYNTAKLADAEINYTTQEMILTDYGTGIWIADLQNPADRFLKNGFKLKQTSNINSARTFGVDVHYTIPMYYFYKWYVNGTLMNNEKAQYLTSSDLKSGDKVKLEVTLRESPDVSSISEEFVVGTDATTVLANTRGNYLYSNQRGRLDLGYVDFFGDKFAIDFWMNAKSDGVILANRQKGTNAVRGFYLSVESGHLNFTYCPINKFELPYNESENTDKYTDEYKINGPKLDMNKWAHVVLSHNREGNIEMYINGELSISSARQMQTNDRFKDLPLNNSLYLSLFADGYELNPIDASVDELKIWNNTIKEEDARKMMFGAAATSSKQIYYNDFNAATLEEQRERFSQKGMAPKVAANIAIEKSAMGICASKIEQKQLSTSWTSFAQQDGFKLDIKSQNDPFVPNAVVMSYGEPIQLDGGSNLTSSFHTVYPQAFGVKLFEATNLKENKVDLKFTIAASEASKYQGASLYSIDITANKEQWAIVGELTFNSADNSLTITSLNASEIDNKRLAIVQSEPAIQVTSKNVDNDLAFYIYRPDAQSLKFEAFTVAGLANPGTYKMLSDQSIVSFEEPFSFTDGKATNSADILVKQDEPFGSKTSVTLTGEDGKVIPYSFDVISKITPKENVNAVTFNKGGANIGSGSSFSGLDGKVATTYMCWFKIDAIAMLTDIKPLLFFRGTETKATGIILNNGKIGCHWNDLGWSWNVDCGLALTASDVGKWHHVAMVSEASGLTFYLDGRKGKKIENSVPGAAIKSQLMLGKNMESDANFVGAIDQVMLFNKSLTADEIHKYMHSRAFLDEPGLVSYIPFDQKVNDEYSDLKNNGSVSFTGIVNDSSDSNIPFNMLVQNKQNTYANAGKVIDGVGFTFPKSFGLFSIYFTTSFSGNAYNYLDPKYPTQIPLENKYRTISFINESNIESVDKASIVIEHENIIAGDSIALVAREIGSLSKFNHRYSALVTTNGTVTIEVPTAIFKNNLTYMFLINPNSLSIGEAKTHTYKMIVDSEVCTINNLRGDAKISVMDLQGKTIATEQSTSCRWSIKLSKGSYVVKVEEFGQTCLAKIII